MWNSPDFLMNCAMAFKTTSVIFCFSSLFWEIFVKWQSGRENDVGPRHDDSKVPEHSFIGNLIFEVLIYFNIEEASALALAIGVGIQIFGYYVFKERRIVAEKLNALEDEERLKRLKTYLDKSEDEK